MKALQPFLFMFAAILLMKVGNLPAQSCEYWSDPAPFSDSLSDNRNAMLVNIPYGSMEYYVFWDRWMEDLGSEIVYIDVYNQDVPQAVVFGEGFTVSNPQVMPVSNWNPPADTMAFVFYETDQSGNHDIYFVVMTDTGFMSPTPFASSPLDESHLRVSPGGGMVWQEGDKILFSRLNRDNSGFYFEPIVMIGEGECRNPDIQNTDLNNPYEEYIAWEKGNQDNPGIWYSSWSYENIEWSDPVLLFEDANHSNPRFSKGIDISSWVPILVSDFIDSAGQYHISGYDFYFQDEFISEFTQPETFQPNLLTIDIITMDYWQTGYLSFMHEEGDDNSDIFSSDFGEIGTGLYNYCRIDSTSQPDEHPQLFQGAWHFSYFDLFCIWESWRNGHWQLFSSTTPVYMGSVPEIARETELKILAYPNPFCEFLWLECEYGKTTDVKMSIYNTYGQLVKSSEEKFLSSGKNLVKIETEELPEGIYLMRMEAGDSAGSIKIVKR